MKRGGVTPIFREFWPPEFSSIQESEMCRCDPQCLAPSALREKREMCRCDPRIPPGKEVWNIEEPEI